MLPCPPEMLRSKMLPSHWPSRGAGGRVTACAFNPPGGTNRRRRRRPAEAPPALAPRRSRPDLRAAGRAPAAHSRRGSTETAGGRGGGEEGFGGQILAIKGAASGEALRFFFLALELLVGAGLDGFGSRGALQLASDARKKRDIELVARTPSSNPPRTATEGPPSSIFAFAKTMDIELVERTRSSNPPRTATEENHLD